MCVPSREVCCGQLGDCKGEDQPVVQRCWPSFQEAGAVRMIPFKQKQEESGKPWTTSDRITCERRGRCPSGKSAADFGVPLNIIIGSAVTADVLHKRVNRHRYLMGLELRTLVCSRTERVQQVQIFTSSRDRVLGLRVEAATSEKGKKKR